MRFVKQCLLAGFLLSVVNASAQNELRPLANLAWPLENAVVPARAAALASSTVAAADGIHSLSHNPAGLTGLDRPRISLIHCNWLEGIRQETASFGLPIRSLGVFGLSLHLVDHGAMEERDINGDVTGSVRPRRFGASLSWGRNVFKSFSFGGSLKGSSQSIAGVTDQALSADLGCQWAITSRIRAGASYCNWGPYVRDFLQASVLRIGAACIPAPHRGHQALFAAALSMEPYGIHRLHLGVEDLIRGTLFLRTGYQFDLKDNPLDGFSGLSAGMGLKLDPLQLDYSFQPFGELGDSHRIGLTYGFGSVAPDPSRLRQSGTPSAQIPSALVPIGVDVGQASAAPAIPASPTPSRASQKSGGNIHATEPGDDLKLYFQLPDESSVTAAVPSETADAIRAGQQKVTEGPSNAAAWMDLGRLYVETGQRELAVQCLEQVLRLRPDFAQLKVWLGKYRIQPKPHPR